MSNGGVDFARLTENLARYGSTRLGGFLMNGSTGESVLLRWTEIYRIWEVAKEAAAAGKIMIAGTGAESTPETIEHTNRAAALGFDFALVRTPNYYKPAMSLEAEATLISACRGCGEDPDFALFSPGVYRLHDRGAARGESGTSRKYSRDEG